MHFLLSYELADDYLQRRELFRADHLGLAWQYVERGELALNGIVKKWTVRKWHTVVGDTASNPLR
jgi:hypothetical protein